MEYVMIVYFCLRAVHKRTRLVLFSSFDDYKKWQISKLEEIENASNFVNVSRIFKIAGYLFFSMEILFIAYLVMQL